MQIVYSLPEDIWQNYVDQHPSGNIFHTREMFHVFENSDKCKPTLIAALDQRGLPLAILLPVQITLKNGILRHITTRSIAYGSVLWNFSPQGFEALDCLLHTYLQSNDHTSLFTELRNISNLFEVQPILSRHGFVYADHLNYLINLNAAPEAVFQNIGHRTRKNIRHGLNRGDVVIKQIQDRSQIPACYNLLRQTYQAAQVPLADISLFESAFDVLYPKGMIRFSLAYVGSQVAATSVELLYKTSMYGWYGGMDREYSAHAPNEILMWKILEWGVQNGYHTYDFGGAGKPGEEYGVRDFKAKFGGQLVNYGRNICVHNKALFKVAEIGYEQTRKYLFSKTNEPALKVNA
jgi:hypothetical protein